jgi:hypothetical protein
MTVDELRSIVKREPFQPFTIHLNDGSRLRVTQPDNFFAPPSWRTDFIVALDNGRWSWVYIRNVAHVTTRGGWPKMSGRKRRNGSSGGSD